MLDHLGYYTVILALCWMTLAVLCILVYENNRLSREEKRVMYLGYAVLAAASFAEWLGVQLDGRADIPAGALALVKCVDYVLTPAAGGVLAMQMRLRNRRQALINAIVLVNAVFQLFAVFNGWVVVVDEQNRYSHGPLFPVYIGICCVIYVLGVSQFITYGRTFKRKNRVSLYATMFMILIAVSLQLIDPPGFRTAYVGLVSGAALLFIHLTEFSQLTTDETIAEQRARLMLSQIKPHFLFNTLGSIEALCELDPKAAKMATRRFSQYLRGNVNFLTSESLVPFDQELQHTSLYLELEQMRFGDALKVEYSIEARDFFLPPLTLEPIVENAVKHGVRQNEDGRGTVWITAKEHDDRYELQVVDDGPGLDSQALSEDGEQVGIRNVRERLRRTCGGSLTVAPAPGNGTIAKVLLPKSAQRQREL